MNRLLSRREKDGHSHRRQKSRDKSTHDPDKNEPDKKFVFNHSMSSLSAAFSKPLGKAAPSIQSSKLAPTVTTSTNGRFGLLLQTRPLSSEIIGLFKYDPLRKLDKEQDAKIQVMRDRLTKEGFTNIGEQQLQYGLFSKHANGDIDKALQLVRLFQESVEGLIKKYDPAVEMKGAVNSRGVTCWLDSLLFGMFARLPSFEPILYTMYDDEPRRRLSTLLRLWVNMLRTGMLINTDVTSYIQEALVECGWEDAGKNKQQDASEAFSFITETLQLPLLTLKMDLYHDGVTDPKDDHKRVYERLLEVAIPPKPEDGQVLQLENCLENYFNNRVEVKRMLERSHPTKRERSNTMSSVNSSQSEKITTSHVEVSELSSPNTPISIHPPTFLPMQPRNRTQSIIRRRIVDDEETDPSTTHPERQNSIRKQSLRNEVVLPAWQFFNLIRPSPFHLHIPSFTVSSTYERHVLIGGLAWYTKSTIPKDASLAAHFSQTRPVLGICLKRYSMTDNGKHALKNSTYVDIPLELQLPHFVPDETMEDEGPSLGNFKLSLQSVICHEGNSVHEGHYFSYIRAAEISDGDCASDRRLSSSSMPPDYPLDKWIRHNDLAIPRVEYVDITKALKEKTPYLLFYQVQPILDDSSQGASTIDLAVAPPSYDSGNDMKFTQSSPQIDRNPFHALIRQQEEQQKPQQQGYFDITRDDTIQSSVQPVRISSEIERPIQSIILPEDRRGSVAFTETSIGSARSISAPSFISAPVTPSEETTTHRLSRAASRFRKSGSKSRPTSSSGENRISENRISATFSRLAARSKEQLNKIDISPHKDTMPVVQGTDGTADLRESVPVSVEEVALKPPSDVIPSRKTSRRGRKQEMLEKIKVHDNDTDEYQTHHKNEKGTEALVQNGKKVPDRECMIM